jgi:hypothetical protein
MTDYPGYKREKLLRIAAERRADALAAALTELLAAADATVTSDDDIAAMLRYGKAVETALALLHP